MHPTTTTTITAGPAPIDLAAIGHELDEAVRRWREIDERTAVLTVLRLALDTRNNYPDAAWLTLLWSDQPGTAHLVVGAVYDEDGYEIADGCDDDGNDTAFNLTDSNQHIWQRLLPHDPMRDAYRLVIDTTLAAGPPALVATNTDDDATAGTARPPQVEIVSYRDPDCSTELRLFLDGTETTRYRWWEADPGAGHTLHEWRDSARHHAAEATPAAAEAIRRYWQTGERSDHVE